MKFVSLYFCCPFHPTSISLCCERLTYIVHYWPDLKGKSCYSLMDALLVGPQLKFKLVKAIFSFNYLFGRQESPAVAGERPPGFFFKRDEHLEWDHKVFGSAAWRRLSCLSVALITHFSSCSGIYLPFLPLLLLYYFVQIVSPSALPAFSRSLSLMCQSLQVSFRPSLNCMVKTSWFLSLSFFWPTNLSLLLHAKHCTLNVP